VRVLSVPFDLPVAGAHELHVQGLDPGVVLDQVVIRRTP
jgi:hypothetical protein